MRRFTVHDKFYHDFIKMMKKFNSDKYKHHVIRSGTHTHTDILLMDDSERFLYYAIPGYKKFAIVGREYRVIVGHQDSIKLGYMWNFEEGDIVKCIELRKEDGYFKTKTITVEYRDIITGRFQFMSLEHTPKVLEEIQ